jgi:hypothetical protein
MSVAPVVKWISQQSSELSFQVRVLAGAQKVRSSFCAPEHTNCFVCVQDEKGGAMFLFERSERQKPRAGVAKNFRQKIYS